MRVRARLPKQSARVRTRLDAHTKWYRCDVCATEEIAGQPGPPGALRHHKAYGTGVVLVLNPASNTALRLTPPLPSLRLTPSLSSPARPYATLVHDIPRVCVTDRGTKPDRLFLETAAGTPLTTAASHWLFNNQYLWQKLARRPAYGLRRCCYPVSPLPARPLPRVCSPLRNLRPWDTPFGDMRRDARL